MNCVLALARLGFNFLKDLLVSGWVTARIILRRGPLP